MRENPGLFLKVILDFFILSGSYAFIGGVLPSIAMCNPWVKRVFNKWLLSVACIACANMAGAQWYSKPSQNRGASRSAFGAGGTTYYNNANGSSAGSSTRMGNTTYYYGPNGAPAGSATRTGW
jgi:hypothetical protein